MLIFCSPKPANNKYNIKQKLNKINTIDDDITNSVQPTYTNEELLNIIENLRELTTRSFDSVLRVVKDKYVQGKINISFREYFMKALSTRIEKLEERRIKNKAKQDLKHTSRNKKPTPYTGKVPIYNWLEESK
ncbi:hypothetical protein CN500_31425 [Bacillus cereus]|nr:hypothetical protein CN500_31425 [Bacillus cereus]